VLHEQTIAINAAESTISIAPTQQIVDIVPNVLQTLPIGTRTNSPFGRRTTKCATNAGFQHRTSAFERLIYSPAMCLAQAANALLRHVQIGFAIVVLARATTV